MVVLLTPRPNSLTVSNLNNALLAHRLTRMNRVDTRLLSFAGFSYFIGKWLVHFHKILQTLPQLFPNYSHT